MEIKEPFQYYWCINCGHHGDFGKTRIRGTDCEECGYEDVTPFNKEEITEDKDLSFEKFIKK